MKYIRNLFQVILLFLQLGPSSFFRVMSGYSSNIRFGFLYAAYECGLLEALQQPRSSDELAQILNVKRPEFLTIILQLGMSLKGIKKEKNQYILNGALSKKIITDKGAALLGMIQTSLSYGCDTYLNFSAIMNGTMAPGGYKRKIGEQIARASKITEGLVFQYARSELKSLSSPRILEVGCGSGIHLRNAAILNSNCSGTGVDFDESVVQQAIQNMKKWDLSNRFTILKGDIRNPPEGLTGPYDIVTFYNLAYYFNSEERKDIFKYLKGILKSDGTLLLAGATYREGGDPVAPHFSLVLISYGIGYPVPTIKQLRNELSIAGFKNTSIAKLLPGTNIYGLKAYK